MQTSCMSTCWTTGGTPLTCSRHRSSAVSPRVLCRTQEKVLAGVTAAAGAAMASPLAAEAAVTPSLKNLLLSVVAGGTVLVGLFGAVTLVAQFDPVNRGK